MGISALAGAGPICIITADLLSGKDEWAMRYISYYRSQQKKEQSAT